MDTTNPKLSFPWPVKGQLFSTLLLFFVIWVSFGEGKKRSIATELRNLYGEAAKAYVFNQDCYETRIQLNTVLLLSRDYRNARTLVGKCSTELGFKEEAKALLEEEYKAHPKSTDAFIWLQWNRLFLKENPYKLLNEWETVFANSPLPMDTNYLTAFAFLLEATERDFYAVEIYNKLIELLPAYPFPHVRKAAILYKLRETTEGDREMKMAKALGYKDVTLTLNLKKSSIINTSYAKVE
ncbi:hypothetical protein LEP1GSC047_0173 [Leptospira inadai serovar Lyme str. 10]|uniref:Tetratricopeptide repeat protein n=2 Tax=Leptospira inadai serovar Lyme TaxID=293084 RepID=V6HF74_9LEPT|nr:hypothetical protein [Leptospira inadai]EQA38912.1 hypothetical protein LEP1GSC047_0173 [Leptospira inadai serovar Lyme str. 10]PNV72133.1 hypothetical protein BES34_020105 [Leptospira inadai serovar Lyme]